MTYIHVKMKLRNCVDFLLQMYNVQHEEGLQLQQTTVVPVPHTSSVFISTLKVSFFSFPARKQTTRLDQFQRTSMNQPRVQTFEHQQRQFRINLGPIVGGKILQSIDALPCCSISIQQHQLQLFQIITGFRSNGQWYCMNQVIEICAAYF